MTKGEDKSAETVYRQKNGGYGYPEGESASFKCPYEECGVLSQHSWALCTSGVVPLAGPGANPRRELQEHTLIVAANCHACEREVVFVDGEVVYPRFSDAPVATSDMPDVIAEDFNEARQIANKSPRGAAALLRLAIQKLCKELGSEQKDINAAIGELVREGKISSDLQRALDSVRVIGNEAVHPGVMDLQDDRATASALFGLVNFIVEKGISEPKRIAEIYASLPPNKLAGIAQRDGRQP